MLDCSEIDLIDAELSRVPSKTKVLIRRLVSLSLLVVIVASVLAISLHFYNDWRQPTLFPYNW